MGIKLIISGKGVCLEVIVRTKWNELFYQDCWLRRNLNLKLLILLKFTWPSYVYFSPDWPSHSPRHCLIVDFFFLKNADIPNYLIQTPYFSSHGCFNYFSKNAVLPSLIYYTNELLIKKLLLHFSIERFVNIQNLNNSNIFKIKDLHFEYKWMQISDSHFLKFFIFFGESKPCQRFLLNWIPRPWTWCVVDI